MTTAREKSTCHDARGSIWIGFFSVFMLGENVTVTSRRYDAAVSDTRILEFQKGLRVRPILREPSANEKLLQPGTRVSVALCNRFDEKGGLLYRRTSSSSSPFRKRTRLRWPLGGCSGRSALSKGPKVNDSVAALPRKMACPSPVMNRLLDVDAPCLSMFFSVRSQSTGSQVGGSGRKARNTGLRGTCIQVRQSLNIES
jgi:hypothetical protein